MRPIRDRDAITAVFELLDDGLDGEMTVYLLGGGAMTFRGLKSGTRDVDLLVASRNDFDRLRELLYARGYEKVDDPVDEYTALGAALILDQEGECRFDIFDREVIRKLRLTEAMKERANDVFSGDHLRVCALSNEDIFLFKGVAGRARDSDDMAQLVQAERGLDFDVVAAEFQSQLPLNKGAVEWELFTEAPESHPVIAFERAVLSLPITLPDGFTSVIEDEANRVYAEFELIQAISDRVSIDDLTEILTSRSAVPVSDRDDVEAIVESLVAKDILIREDDTVRLNEFDSTG